MRKRDSGLKSAEYTLHKCLVRRNLRPETRHFDMSSIWACVIPREDSLHLDIIYEGSEGEPRLGHEDLYPGEDVWGIPYDTWLAHAGEERVDVTELARSLLAEGWPDLSL